MIKVYTLPNCPKCEDLKSYMKKNYIAYREENVEANPRALAKMTYEGINDYPVLEIDGRIYSENVNTLKSIISKL